MRSLILAVRFLTVVPVPGREATGPAALGRAAWWFPVIGLILGVVLALAGHAADALFPPLVVAALLVALWKGLSGAIHLDGLADSLDGLAGGDVARRLAIMRDSHIGVFGAAGLAMFLLVSVAAVADLDGPVRNPLLIVAPVLGRVTPLLAGAWLQPATPEQGLGAAFTASLSRWTGPVYMVAGAILAERLIGPWGVAIAVVAWTAALLWALLAARRLGGLTGDLLGAVIELTELVVLLGGAAAEHRGLI